MKPSKTLSRTLLGATVTAAFALTGCSSGQVTQTDTMPAAVPGANDEIVDLENHVNIAVRDVLVEYQAEGYDAGDDVPIVVRVFNNGRDADHLIAVESSVAESVSLVEAEGEDGDDAGETELPAEEGEPNEAEEDGEDSGADEEEPAEDDGDAVDEDEPAEEEDEADAALVEIPAGDYVALDSEHGAYLVLENVEERLQDGAVVTLSFEFAEAGTVEMDVPFGLPTEPGERETLEVDDDGH